MKKIHLLATSILLILLPSCGHRSGKKAAATEKDYKIFDGRNIPEKAASEKVFTVKTKQVTERSVKELDFEVHNSTEQTIFVTCFSYTQKERRTRWRWDKSPVYEIVPHTETMVNIDTILDEEHRESTFGYLAIFNNKQAADDAIYELTEDNQKIDLDLLFKLENKKVVIDIKKYGFKKEQIDFAVVDKFEKKHIKHELDFLIENNTEKPILITAFIYQITDEARTVWSFHKTAVQRLEPGQISIVDVDSIPKEESRLYATGVLGIFEDNEYETANDATYELLPAKNKVHLGNLSKLKGQKVAVEVEQYGLLGEISEFNIKPAESPIKQAVVATCEAITPELPPQAPLPTEAPAQEQPVKRRRKTNKTYKLFN